MRVSSHSPHFGSFEEQINDSTGKLKVNSTILQYLQLTYGMCCNINSSTGFIDLSKSIKPKVNSDLAGKSSMIIKGLIFSGIPEPKG